MLLKSPFLGYLGKNYAPSTQEIGQIKTLVKTQQALLDGIDKEIEALKARRLEHARLIEEHTHLLSPIHQVPTDILTSIFLACIPDVDTFAPVTISGTHPALVISHVSQRWRQITLNCPQLWAKFNFSAPLYPIRPYQHTARPCEEADALYEEDIIAWVRKASSFRNLMQLWFTRSAQCPLYFHAVFRDFRNLHDIEIPDDIADSISALVDLLLGTSERWKRAELTIEILRLDSPLWSLIRLDGSDLPLKTFRIDVMKDCISGTVSREIEDATSRMSIFRASSLRSITAVGLWVPFSTIRVQWLNITELNLRQPVERAKPGSGARDAIEIFKSFPNLVRCALTLNHPSVLGWGSPLPPQKPPLLLPLDERLPLPFLTSMSIRGPLPSGLASSLHLPSLNTLFLVGSSDHPQGEDESGVVEWIRHFGGVLADVTLDYSTLTQSALYYSLGRLSNVVTLRLLDVRGMDRLRDRWGFWTGFDSLPDQAFISNSLLQRLGTKLNEDGSEALSEHGFCPNLQRFGCRMSEFEFSERALLEFIASRRGIGSRKGPTLLTSFFVRFGATQRLDLRSELEKMDVYMEDFVLVESYTKPIPIGLHRRRRETYAELPSRDRYVVHPDFPSGVF